MVLEFRCQSAKWSQRSGVKVLNGVSVQVSKRWMELAFRCQNAKWSYRLRRPDVSQSHQTGSVAEYRHRTSVPCGSVLWVWRILSVISHTRCLDGGRDHLMKATEITAGSWSAPSDIPTDVYKLLAAWQSSLRLRGGNRDVQLVLMKIPECVCLTVPCTVRNQDPMVMWPLYSPQPRPNGYVAPVQSATKTQWLCGPCTVRNQDPMAMWPLYSPQPRPNCYVAPVKCATNTQWLCGPQYSPQPKP
jgi:hypothetical protein